MALFNEYAWKRERKSGINPDDWKWVKVLEPSFTATFWRDRKVRKAGKNYACSACKAEIRSHRDFKTGGWQPICMDCSREHFNAIANYFEECARTLRDAVRERK